MTAISSLGALKLPVVATPTAPASGVHLYTKADSFIYRQAGDGTEVALILASTAQIVTGLKTFSVAGQSVKIAPTADAPASVTTGGALLLDNTGSIGAGAVLYSNRGADATGRVLVVNTVNTANVQAAAFVSHAGSGDAVVVSQTGTGRGILVTGSGGATAGKHAVSIGLTNSGSTSSSALSLTSANSGHSTLEISGVENARGTIKTTHTGDGTDTNASGLSLDLRGTDANTVSAAQGIFIDSTVGGTSGKLLNLRNKGVDQLVLTPQAGLATSNMVISGDFRANGDLRSATGVYDNGNRAYSASNPPPTPTGFEPTIANPTAPSLGQYWRGDKTWQPLDLAALGDWTKKWVAVATTANISLSTYPLTIDGYAVAVGDRVLAKNQTDPSQNGIYVVAASGTTWARAADASTALLCAGMAVAVRYGAASGADVYTTSFRATDTLGTTGMYFAQDYSDLNPPDTLQMTKLAAASVTTTSFNGPSATGQVILNAPVDGASLVLTDETGTQRTVGAVVPDSTLLTEYTTTKPAAPATGLKLFTRQKSRRLPAFETPDGRELQLQTAIHSSKIARMNAANNIAQPTVDGTSITFASYSGTTATTVPTAIQVAGTNQFTSQTRFRLTTSSTTAQTGCEARASSSSFFHSAVANMGGYFFVARCGLPSTTTVAGTKMFIGMWGSANAIDPTINPSTLSQAVGFGWDSTDSLIYFMSAQSSSTKVATQFANTATQVMYEYRLYIPSGGYSASSGINILWWSVQRLSDGAISSGVVTDGSTLPPSGTMLCPHMFYGNGTVAAANNFDIQSMYIETDS